jgi:hypothetical protein
VTHTCTYTNCTRTLAQRDTHADAFISNIQEADRRRGRCPGARTPGVSAAGSRLSLSVVAAKAPRSEDAPAPSPSGDVRLVGPVVLVRTRPRVCDLNPGVPNGKTVLGRLAVVACYNRGAGEWRVFDDASLAPTLQGLMQANLICNICTWTQSHPDPPLPLPASVPLSPVLTSQRRRSSYLCLWSPRHRGWTGPGFFLPLATARFTAVTAPTAGVR